MLITAVLESYTDNSLGANPLTKLELRLLVGDVLASLTHRACLEEHHQLSVNLSHGFVYRIIWGLVSYS